MLRRKNGEHWFDFVTRMDSDFTKYRKEFIKMVAEAIGMNKKVYFRESTIYDSGIYVDDCHIKLKAIDVTKEGIGVDYTSYEFGGDARRNINGKNRYNNLCVMSMQTYWYIAYAITHLVERKVNY